MENSSLKKNLNIFLTIGSQKHEKNLNAWFQMKGCVFLKKKWFMCYMCYKLSEY